MEPGEVKNHCKSRAPVLRLAKPLKTKRIQEQTLRSLLGTARTPAQRKKIQRKEKKQQYVNRGSGAIFEPATSGGWPPEEEQMSSPITTGEDEKTKTKSASRGSR